MTDTTDALIIAIARARGVTEQVIRLEYGIPEPDDSIRCEFCGAFFESQAAADACCRD